MLCHPNHFISSKRALRYPPWGELPHLPCAVSLCQRSCPAGARPLGCRLKCKQGYARSKRGEPRGVRAPAVTGQPGPSTAAKDHAAQGGNGAKALTGPSKQKRRGNVPDWRVEKGAGEQPRAWSHLVRARQPAAVAVARRWGARRRRALVRDSCVQGNRALATGSRGGRRERSRVCCRRREQGREIES